MPFLDTLTSGLIGVGSQFLNFELQQKAAKQNMKAALTSGAVLGGFGKPLPDVAERLPTPGQVKRAKISTRAAEIAAAGGVPKKRRRTNYANTRALTRALRRAEGFVRLVKRTEKMRRKLAPPSRKSSRRDIPANHTHVR
jgi:hypothetical protein